MVGVVTARTIESLPSRTRMQGEGLNSNNLKDKTNQESFGYVARLQSYNG